MGAASGRGADVLVPSFFTEKTRRAMASLAARRSRTASTRDVATGAGSGRFPRPLRLAALLAAVAVALVVAIQVYRSRSAGGATSLPAATSRLSAALGKERPIEARLAGGFPHLPLRPIHRSGDGASGPDVPLKLAAEAARVLEETPATPEGLAVRGTAHLLIGEWDAAIEDLEKAAAAPEEGAAVLTNLSAAYLARWRATGQHAGDAARALASAERALAGSPDSPEALFNRALALEAVAPDRAKRAWSDYLERESASGWADEARRHLVVVRQPEG